ncbi:MAG: hypothetical protein JWM68_5616 [Verrucomicrobiales bacterium]|nr:hypothetical protein [Verrucomicrobiales bacterium]
METSRKLTARSTGNKGWNKIRSIYGKKREAGFLPVQQAVCVMNVKHVKKIALTISILGFTVGFSDLQENIYFWLGRPVGAIAFIVFFIFMVLENEFALLDEQESNKVVNSADQSSRSTARTTSSNKENRTPALTTSSSH